MQSYLRRAHRVYKQEGSGALLSKSARFLLRATKHKIGLVGFYNSDYYLRVLKWSNSGYGQYKALADPLKIIYVDPSSIKYVTGRGPNPGRFRWQDIGTIAAGDWDKNNESFEDLPVVQALRQRFEHNTPWEEIEFIQHVMQEAKRGNPVWRGCTSADDVKEACKEVDELYEQIKNEGYRTQQELLSDEDLSGDPLSRFRRYDEVTIDIARDGRLLFADGRHRLTISKILDLDSIPVRISARHREWQLVRERFAKNDSISEISEEFHLYKSHPDLEDILSNR